MTQEQWDSVAEYFSGLEELPPQERARGMAAISDAEVRAEVASLLRHSGLGSELSDLIGAVAVDLETLEAGAERLDLDWLQPGVRVAGKYVLQQKLGEGGMGVVYRAFDETLQRAAALKFLTTNHTRLLAEARAASALNHPNIVTVYEFGSDRGVDFMAMEFVDGDTLLAAIARGPLAIETLIEVGTQAADVLDAAHRAGIVHGDIKPANLIFTKSGQIKLADFGIARRSNETPILAGTLSYMSPEQSRGELLDGRSDIYSLGVVLYEAAFGVRPPARAHRADLPSALDEILARTLADAAEQRFPTAGELRDALRRLVPREASPVTHLPSRVTRLIGREQALAEVSELLSGEVRLLNLTGPGGIGKTRLAVEVAHQVAAKFDCTWFIALESIREPGAIAPAILRGLGLREADARSPLANLIEYFEHPRALLILDNFEHLTGGAPVLSELLDRCPRLRILVTSRASLHLRAEREYVVPALTISTEATTREELLELPGVALFLDRGHGGQPALETLQAIAEICARVDGIPLAIELAAARTKVLAPKSILGRLSNRFQLLKGGARDLPQRHQTLRDTLDWSYDLLEADEKLLLQRLSVFDDGAAVEAIEEVCSMDALDLLMSLADKSLLRQPQDGGSSRIRMLETVREYARDRLTEAGELGSFRKRHAAYYLALAERRADFDLLEAEHGNCNAALEWFLTNDPPGALRLAVALWPFWEARGYWTEGRAQLKRVLASSAGAGRVKALYAAGVLADAQGDYAAARVAFEEHLALQRTSDPRTVATAMNNLGIVALRQGDYAAARAAYAEALEILRALGSKRGLSQCLNNLGHVALGQGDYKTARAHYEESLAISRAVQSTVDIAWTLSNLGDVAREEGRLEEARGLYSQSFSLFRGLEERAGLASCMADLGNLSTVSGEYLRAAQFYQESLVIFGDLGDQRGMLRVLEGFAGLASARGLHEAVLRLAGAATALRTSLGVRLAERQQVRRDEWMAAARLSLGGRADALLAEGQRMRIEKAIECALASAAV